MAVYNIFTFFLQTVRLTRRLNTCGGIVHTYKVLGQIRIRIRYLRNGSADPYQNEMKVIQNTGYLLHKLLHGQSIDLLTACLQVLRFKGYGSFWSSTSRNYFFLRQDLLFKIEMTCNIAIF